MARYPHVNKANQYARSVVRGKTPACKSVVLACQRHLDDLEKTNWRYRFDKDLAERPCTFIHLLPHVKGKWAAKRQLIELSPWQTFVVVSIFGWVDKKTGNRRFRDAYIEVPRKAGKSVLAAAVGLYCFAADGEYGAEVYAGATGEKQAWEVFRPARQMALKLPDLCSMMGIEVNAKTMMMPEDGSRFETLIGNPGDGASPSCAIIDEYHEHPNSSLYDTMKTGMGARDQALALVITTAGSNIGGPCYELRTDVLSILNGAFEDDTIFGLIYGIDEGDDWTTLKAIRKANPNCGISVSEEFLQTQVKRAIQSPTNQNAIKTKHFNIWVGAKTAWLNMETWHRCVDKTLKIEDFADDQCYVSVDLASKIDVAAIVLLFTRMINGRRHYYAFPRFYLPESAVESSKNAQRYRGWTSTGLLTVNDGEEINFPAIEEEFTDKGGILDTFSVSEVVYDPWQATQFAQNLDRAGATAVEFRNTVQNMSPAMKELEAAITGGRFHFDGNQVLTWMASNTVAKLDAKDNIFPRKEQPANKIDGIVALIMAVGRAYHAEDSRSIYESEELYVI